jgi:type II secretory pathway component GspD/PulD (secretin)
MVGNSRIMADKRSNAILVIGSTDIKDKVSQILDQLDVRTPQVMLTTVIGELTLSEGEEFGASYILHNGKRSVLDGKTVVTGSSTSDIVGGISNLSSDGMALNLSKLLSNTAMTRAFSGGAGGLGGFVSVGDSLGALVTALESTSKFKVTSRPSLFTSNNKKASIVSGEKIAVITGSQSSPTTTGNSVVNQVQYIPVNLSLEVVPLINSDKEVYLDVVQSLDEVTGSTPIKDSNGVNNYPIIANRQLQTSVMVPNDGTLVLGGLIKDTRKKEISGIPILGKIPLLGGLFRSTSDTKTRTELLVLIRPSVSMDPKEGYEVRDRNLKPFRIPRTLEEDLIAPEPPTKKGQPKPPTKSFRADPAAVQQGGDSSKAATSEPVTIPVVTPVEQPASPKGKAPKAQTKPSAS